MRNSSSYFFIFLSVVLGLSSCVTQKKSKRVVQKVLINEKFNGVSSENDFIVVDTERLEKNDSILEVSRLKAYVVPAIVFNVWNKTLQFDINTKYFVDVFTKILNEKAELYNLKTFLKGKSIVIDMLKVPSRFRYSDEGSVLFALVFYSYNYSNVISYKNQELSFVYHLMDGKREVLRRSYKRPFQASISGADINSYDFLAEFTTQYSDLYKEVCDDLIQKMIDDL